jgi:hypothetical protein
MLRVYLDTSVFRAYFDSRVPGRQRETEAFWSRRAKVNQVNVEAVLPTIEILAPPEL